MSTAETLLAAIDSFLKETGMAETTFGLRVLNDGKLVSRIRAGSGITLKTNDRIHAYIEAERSKNEPKRASRRGAGQRKAA